MNKEKTLQSIQDAIKTYDIQLEKIALAIQGKEIKDIITPDRKNCEFGQWFYNSENKLRDILGSFFYDQIEVLHIQWHNEYEKIFNILFKKQKKGFLSKILGSSKIDEMELDKVKLYHNELTTTTKELLKILGSSERRISALPESKFN
jgi:hypothetical protein